jgi:hypothetical protein
MVTWDIRGSAARQRGAAILEQIRARQSLCLRTLGGDRAGEERAGRFFANPRVTAARIVESWSEHTTTAVAGRHVLAIQDTSDVTFRTRPDRRRGLGLISGETHGVLVHAMLAVDAASGACLGLVGGAVWNRPGLIKTHHNKRPLSERESRRWVDTAESAKPVLAGAAMVTVVADRESDLFALWARVPEPDFHLLSRVQVDRKLAPSGEMAPEATAKDPPPTLFNVAATFPARGTRTLDLPYRGPGRSKRQARVALRFGAVSICRPRLEHDKTLAKTVKLSLVEVRETNPPDGEEAVHWRLMTTHPVEDAVTAWRIVDWYRMRWVIEQLFRTMKSQGLRLEDSQMASADRLMKLTAAATKAACLDLQLVQERNGQHKLEARVAFSEEEIDTVERLLPKLEGRTERQRNPHPPRSLAQASWVIARLGGWNCFYGPPGPIVIRRGVERFQAIHLGRLLGPGVERDVRLA